ncbi:MAG: glycoside hydrolase family 32 protein [Candidatus Nealsonbacteria bacterium]|nr:glycoside hydrolase family 32 protein [Candidatus Nealsonbacteria bacterium]
MRNLLLTIVLFTPAVLRAEADDDAAGLPGEVAAFRQVVQSKDLDTFSKRAVELRRWMIENDPHRPIYHFTGPESWINDPNGVIYHQGKYHLFYQFDPIVDGRRSKRCWGHAVSDDLVHWVDWPVAIWPNSPHDRGGVYSGNMVIDDDGVPTALYTGNVRGHAECYGMQARSHDGMLTWKKKMVMDKRPTSESPVHWDAQIWKDGENWFQLIGGRLDGKGAAQLWSSPDLDRWTYRKAICSGLLGGYWELPYLIELGGRHVLLVGAGNPYWIGTYDRQTMTFTPDRSEPTYVDPGTYYSFNVHMVDDKGPGNSRRQLMHGWVTGPASPTKTVPYWQGAHSIPRVITLCGRYLRQEPIPELQVLRGPHRQLRDLTIQPDGTGYLSAVQGDALEIVARFDVARSQATRFGVKVRVSADGKKFVRVWYDPATEQFGTDGSVLKKVSAWGGIVNSAATDDTRQQTATLRIFVDRSVLEVYCGGNALTNRTFPDGQALGVDLFAEGGAARVQQIDVWQMKSPCNPR